MPTPYNEWRWVERSFAGDLKLLLKQLGLAWSLYLADVAENKRNSGLGLIAPFISVLVHVLLLGSVMSLVFGEDIATFMPFFAISFSIWQGISIFISDVSTANDKATRFISFPNISGYISILIASFEFFIALSLKLIASFFIIIFINPQIIFSANFFEFFIALVVLSIALISCALPLAYIFDRIRLLRGFLPQLLFAVYLVTPILWTPDRLSNHRWVVDYNPVFHMVEIARTPLLSGSLSWISLAVVVAISIVGTTLSRLIFPANRDLIVYRWVA